MTAMEVDTSAQPEHPALGLVAEKVCSQVPGQRRWTTAVVPWSAARAGGTQALGRWRQAVTEPSSGSRSGSGVLTSRPAEAMAGSRAALLMHATTAGTLTNAALLRSRIAVARRAVAVADRAGAALPTAIVAPDEAVSTSVAAQPDEPAVAAGRGTILTRAARRAAPWFGAASLVLWPLGPLAMVLGVWAMNRPGPDNAGLARGAMGAIPGSLATIGLLAAINGFFF